MNVLSSTGAGVSRRGPSSPISRENARLGSVDGKTFVFLQLVNNPFLRFGFVFNVITLDVAKRIKKNG